MNANAYGDVEAVLAPAAFGWVQLQLEYDGRRPPVALLDDIARLGWAVPPPPARPASAIDWYTPDPLTGERFTVKQWTAVHDIDPPGREARSIWSADQRAGALRALGPVLSGYHVPVTSPVPDLLALLADQPPAPAPARPAPAPAPAAPPDDGPVIVSFTASIESHERVDGFLRTTGLAYWLASEVRTRRQVFRGSVSEADVKVLVGEVVVRADQAIALQDRLREEQAAVQARPASADDLDRIDAVRADPTGPGPLGPPEAGPPERREPGGEARLRLELGMAGQVVIDRLAGHPALAGLDLVASPGTRMETASFRGSSTEVPRPCLHLEVSCPLNRVAVVRAVLAHEAGVTADRVERLS